MTDSEVNSANQPDKDDSVKDGNPYELGLEKGFELYALFRDYAKHEDGLTNNRITWMLTIHGFLYATYGLVLQKKFDLIPLLLNPPVHEEDKLTIYRHTVCTGLSQINIFASSICLVGMTISTAGLVAMFAAHDSINTVTRLYRSQAKIRRYDPSSDAYGHDDTRTLERPMKGYQRYVIKHGVYLPTLAGGGSGHNRAIAFSAATSIPLALLSSWVISLFVTLEYSESNVNLSCGLPIAPIYMVLLILFPLIAIVISISYFGKHIVFDWLRGTRVKLYRICKRVMRTTSICGFLLAGANSCRAFLLLTYKFISACYFRLRKCSGR